MEQQRAFEHEHGMLDGFERTASSPVATPRAAGNAHASPHASDAAGWPAGTPATAPDFDLDVSAAGAAAHSGAEHRSTSLDGGTPGAPSRATTPPRLQAGAAAASAQQPEPSPARPATADTGAQTCAQPPPQRASQTEAQSFDLAGVRHSTPWSALASRPGTANAEAKVVELRDQLLLSTRNHALETQENWAAIARLQAERDSLQRHLADAQHQLAGRKATASQVSSSCPFFPFVNATWQH